MRGRGRACCGLVVAEVRVATIGSTSPSGVPRSPAKGRNDSRSCQYPLQQIGSINTVGLGAPSFYRWLVQTGLHHPIAANYADFDLISEVAGQPTEWVVPRGSID